jgi:hypothetical protein
MGLRGCEECECLWDGLDVDGVANHGGCAARVSSIGSPGVRRR